MKRTYSAPVMYREAYIAEQYIAASDCGTSVGVPDHGHFSNKNGDTHCAFTASNCGENATSCQTSTGGVCNSFNTNTHKVITRESDLDPDKPGSGHNCHVLSTNEAAQAFVSDYAQHDSSCANGVATLLGLTGGFEEISKIFS